MGHGQLVIARHGAGRCTAGGAAAVRQMAGMPIAPHDAEMLEGFLAPARATVSLAEWDAEYGAGRGLSQEQAATLLLALNQ